MHHSFWRRCRPGLAALVLLSGCESCSVPTGPPEEIADTRVLWQVDTPARAEGEPAVAGDRIVMATDSGITAFRQSTGGVAWHAPTRDVRGTRRLLHRAGRVFYAGVASAGAYDASTGALLWRLEFAREASPDDAWAAVDDRALYIGTRDRRILAIAPESGRALWDVRGDEASWLGGEVGGVALSGDTVYAALNRLLTPNRYKMSVVMLALDRRTGRELWRSQTTDEFTGGGAPVVAGRLLIGGGGTDGYTIAVDRFTGQEVWRRDLYGYVWGAPVSHGGRVYLGTQAARLYALDAATGKSVWETALEGGSTHVAVCGNKLVVENSQVELFDINSGKQIGSKIQLAPGSYVNSGIAVAGNQAFFAGQRKLYAVRCD